MYKVEKYIEKCIISVVNQQSISGTDYEIIAINDGSPDKSFELATKLSDQYSNLRVLSQDNAGLGATRNRGIREAAGDFVWCVDSDDWIEPHAVSFIISAIKSKKFDFMTISARFSDSGKVYNVQKQTNDPHELLKSHTWCHNAQFCVYNKIFLDENKLEFTSGIYHEDSEFTPRMMYYAKTCYVSNEILYNTYCNPYSITQSLNSKKSYDNILISQKLLHFIQKNVNEDDIKEAFFDEMSTLINNAIFHITYHQENEKKNFNTHINENIKVLSGIFLSSSKLKFRLEGLLFRYLPFSDYIKMYNLLRFQLKNHL